MHNTHAVASGAHVYNERQNMRQLRLTPQVSALIADGGISGAGTLYDLASHGVNVTRAARGDYCQGAAGTSSHLIRGGIGCLKNEQRLVRESVVQPHALLKTARHRSTTHRRQGRPREQEAFLIKADLPRYHGFSCDGGAVPRHSFAGPKASLARLPNQCVRAYMVEHEHMGRLVDVLLRRTSLTLRGLVTTQPICELAKTLAPFLSRNEVTVTTEIEPAELVLREWHKIELKDLLA